VDVCVVHRCPEIVEQELAMELALVAVTAGTRLPISLMDLRRWVVDGYGIPGNSFSAKRYFPEDFIIVFSYYDDMLWVLHDPPAGSPKLNFIFKRWRRQLHASVEDL
jgi:hypothetical protein